MSQYEKGKWYKNLGVDQDYICKVDEIRGNYFYISEYIFEGNHRNYGGTITNKNAVLITDLSEIQQYLPEGHPDKTPSIPEYVECIKKDSYIEVGKIYKPTKRKPFTGGDVYYLEGTLSPFYISYFKPSTKEAYEAQNKPKSLVGRYMKALESGVNCSNTRKGEYYTVKSETEISIQLNISSGAISKKNLHKFELMPEGWKPEEDLLEEAKKRYPVGTKFCNKNIIPSCTPIYEVKGDYKLNSRKTEITITATNGSGYTIYRDGEWAEIVEEWKPVKGEWRYYMGKEAGGLDTELWKKGVVAQFESRSGDSYRFTNPSFNSKVPICGNLAKAFRKALPSEIPAVTPAIDLRKTKIWIGDNENLAKQVFDKLKSLGVDPRNSWSDYKDGKKDHPRSYYIYENLSLSYSSEEVKKKSETFLCNHDYKIITPAELGIFSSYNVKVIDIEVPTEMFSINILQPAQTDLKIKKEEKRFDTSVKTVESIQTNLKTKQKQRL